MPRGTHNRNHICFVLFLFLSLSLCNFATGYRNKDHKILKRGLSSHSSSSEEQKDSNNNANSKPGLSLLTNSRDNDDDGESIIFKGLFEKQNSVAVAKTNERHRTIVMTNEFNEVTTKRSKQVARQAKKAEAPKKDEKPKPKEPTATTTKGDGECRPLRAKCRRFRECCSTFCNWRIMRCDMLSNMY